MQHLADPSKMCEESSDIYRETRLLTDFTGLMSFSNEKESKIENNRTSVRSTVDGSRLVTISSHFLSVFQIVVRMLSNIDEAFLLSLKSDFGSHSSSNLVSTELLPSYSPIETLSPELEGLSNISSGKGARESFCSIAFLLLRRCVDSNSFRYDQSQRLGSRLLIHQTICGSIGTNQRCRSLTLDERQSSSDFEWLPTEQCRHRWSAACPWTEINSIHLSYLWSDHRIDGASSKTRQSTRAETSLGNVQTRT